MQDLLWVLPVPIPCGSKGAVIEGNPTMQGILHLQYTFQMSNRFLGMVNDEIDHILYLMKIKVYSYNRLIYFHYKYN